MKTQIEKLQEQVKTANTADSKGRQLVANASKKLYNLIEKGLYEKYGERAINEAYNDLCNGNFAEPFMCEKQKEKFKLYAEIYNEKVLPSIQLTVKEKINGSGEPIKYGSQLKTIFETKNLRRKSECTKLII